MPIISDVVKIKNNIKMVRCWKCKQTRITLWVVRDDKGKKTSDYVCENCKVYGKPENINSSRINEEYV